MRRSLAAAALGMLSLAQLSSTSAFLLRHAAPRPAARAALLQKARGGASASSKHQPLGRAGLSRMMATVAPSSAAVKKLSNPQEELLKDVRAWVLWGESGGFGLRFGSMGVYNNQLGVDRSIDRLVSHTTTQPTPTSCLLYTGGRLHLRLRRRHLARRLVD